MIQKMLNFLLIEIVRYLQNEIVTNLHQREMKAWNQSEQGEQYCYLGLQIKISPQARRHYWDWDWFVYDGRGMEILKKGTAKTEHDAVNLAMAWTDDFLSDDENENE